jgi:hypothetical protein
MITLPADVKKGANWDGVSKDPNTGAMVNNLESAMSFAEHQRIVCGARDLLVNMDFTAVDQQANLAKAALMILKAAYCDVDGGTVYISKGIHQPYGNPHIQLTVEKDGDDHLFHLDVSAHEVVSDDSGKEHFHWRGVCFSARVKNNAAFGDPNTFDTFFWPQGVAPTPKRFRDRRDSISGPQLQKVNNAIAEETERRRRDSEQQLKRNAVVAAVASKLKLKPADKFQLPKLWNGEAAKFKTVNGKDIMCTYDGSYFIQNNGQKLSV